MSTEGPWDRKITRGQWLVLVAAVLGWMFDGVEIGLAPIMGRPALIELLGSEPGNDQNVGPWLGVLGAMFLLGAALGGVVFGWLGDRFGRVRTMIFSVLTYSLFTGAAYAAQEAWQLMALRFIASMGMGGQWSLGVALVVECWPGIARPLLAGIIGAAANVGFLMISTLGYCFPVSPGFLALDHAGRGLSRGARVLRRLVRARVRALESGHAQGAGDSGARDLFGRTAPQDPDRHRPFRGRAAGHLGIGAVGALLGGQDARSERSGRQVVDADLVVAGRDRGLYDRAAVGRALGPATGLFRHVPPDTGHEPLHVPRSQVL